MSLQPIDPYDDPRVTHEFAVVNGRRYHYVHGMPKESPPKATILCLHGFPDIWYGWRYIIPALLEKGLRVIVPDMLGYGQTSAPRVPPEDISVYSWKSVSNDMYELVKQTVAVPKVILLGHDWGGVIVSRIYMYHPEIVSHIISVCTPFLPPVKKYMPIREYVEKEMPNFKYQIGFQNPQTEKDLEWANNMRKFLSALHRGIKDPRSGNFMVTKNLIESLGTPPRGSFMTEKDLDYYVKQYAMEGFHSPLNWYRTRKINYLEEKDMEFDKFKVPYLFIGATYDTALPPSIANAQAAWIPYLTSKEVGTGHWALTEAPGTVIGYLDEWLEQVVFGGKSKL